MPVGLLIRSQWSTRPRTHVIAVRILVVGVGLQQRRPLGRLIGRRRAVHRRDLIGIVEGARTGSCAATLVESGEDGLFLRRVLIFIPLQPVQEEDLPESKMRSPLGRLAVEGVEHIIAVASGKGGVGKSTTAVNLAVALALECKLRVGLLDADVYGPSIPTLMKLNGHPQLDAKSKMLPLENFGVRCMSMGFLMEKDAPAVWRGPMVMSALEKLTRGTAWGKIDVMVVDMPPGTGDAQISISQRLPLAGAVIVSTPQDLALVDARRGVTMFQKVNVPILGLIENMSFFKCPKCGERTDVFGHGGAQLTAKEMDMEFLGEVPLNISIRETSDLGNPIVASSPESHITVAYKTIARRIQSKLNKFASSDDSAGPKLAFK